MSSPFPFLVKKAKDTPATAPVKKKDEEEVKAEPFTPPESSEMKAEVVEDEEEPQEKAPLKKEKSSPAKKDASSIIVKKIKMAASVVEKAGINPESAGGGILISKLMDMISSGKGGSAPVRPVPRSVPPSLRNNSKIDSMSLSKLAENLGDKSGKPKAKAGFIDDLKVGRMEEK